MLDAIGQDHEVACAPARIVSLVPSITELLFSLGLDDRIVGRTTFCVHPYAKTSTLASVGGTKRFDMAKLRRLAPTHVIVNIDENRREDVEEMKAFVANIIVTHPEHPRDNIELYRLLGHVFHRTEQAEVLVGEFSRAYDELMQFALALPARRVLYLIWFRPWMSISKTTYIASTLSLIGWNTPFEESAGRYPVLTDETLAHEVFDLVLFSSEPFPFKDKHIDLFADEFGVKREAMMTIDGEMTSWYGSRAIRGMRYLLESARRVNQRS